VCVCVCVYAHGPDRLRQQHAGLAPSVSAKCTLRRAVPSPTLSHWRPSRVVVVVVAFACAATYCVDSSRKSWQFGSTRASEITIHTKSVPQTGRLVCRWHTRAFDWIGLALSLRLLSTTPVLRCMNPSGMRAAVQRPLDAPETHHPGRSRNSNSSNRPLDSASTNSYRSTHSSRSSVLERAREYNRRVEQQNHRSKSLERTTTSTSEAGSLASRTYPSSAAGSRSQSASRATPHARLGTRERAMASVRKERNRTRRRPLRQLPVILHPEWRPPDMRWVGVRPTHNPPHPSRRTVDPIPKRQPRNRMHRVGCGPRRRLRKLPRVCPRRKCRPPGL
jgi:hypothetical protein